MAENLRKGLQVPRNPALALRELNRKHAGGDTNNTIIQTDTQTINPPDTPTHILTDQPPNSPTNQPPNQQTVNPTEKPTDHATFIPPIQQTNEQATQQSNQATNIHTATDTKQQTQPRQPRKTAKPNIRLRDQTPPDPAPRARVDGRTMRIRQDTADRTMVTSFRLTVGTIEQLDEFCWRERMRKQDVIQRALQHFFTSWDAEE